MASLQVRLQDLSTEISTRCKFILTFVNGNLADLSSLTTTAKNNLVAAINELKAAINALESEGFVTIDDALTSSTTQTWSITKINSAMTAAINNVVNNAPGALDTLAEFAAAINNDANFAATITLALSNRLRIDVNNQALTPEQQANGQTNLGVYSKEEIGDPDTDLVAVFRAGLA